MTRLEHIVTDKELQDLGYVHIDKIMLCDNISCDKGLVITDRVTPEGRFELDDCPICNGKGFRIKTK